VLGRTVRILVAAVALAALFGSSARSARGADDLSGYSLAARAPALRLVLDSDLLPVPSHPAVDATIPETSSTLESGPLGHGLASLFWPGDLAGHFGSAIPQLNQLCTTLLPIAIPSLPPQCIAVPQALKDNAQYFNDPFKAETFVPGGPLDVDYFTPSIPGVTMSSHANDNKVDSTAGFGFSAPGVGSVGWIRSHSIASRGSGKATSDATSELVDVALAGGLVTIDHITSAAKETTDGVQAVGAGSTVVSGLRIGGIPATVDDTGLHIGGLSGVVNQALKNLGLQIAITTPGVVNDGAKGSFAAPVLTISYRDDQNALEQTAIAMGQKLMTGAPQPVLSSVQSLALGPQSKVTLSLGGANATVDGSPSFASPAEASVAESPGAEASSIRIEGGASAGEPATAVEGTTFSAPASAGAPVRSVRTPGAVYSRSAGLLDGFGGVAWGLIVAAIAAALAGGYGLYRYALAMDAPRAPHHH